MTLARQLCAQVPCRALTIKSVERPRWNSELSIVKERLICCALVVSFLGIETGRFCLGARTPGGGCERTATRVSAIDSERRPLR